MEEVSERGSAVVLVVARVVNRTLRRPAAIKLEGIDHLSATLDFHKAKYQTLYLAIPSCDAPVRTADVSAFVPHEDVLRFLRLSARIDFSEH